MEWLQDVRTFVSFLADLATIVGLLIAALLAWKQWPQLKAFFARPTFEIGFENGDKSLVDELKLDVTWESESIISNWYHVELVVRNNSELTASDIFATANIDSELFARQGGQTLGHNNRILEIKELTLHPHTMTSFSFDVAFKDDVVPEIPPRVEVTVYYPNTKPVHKVLLIIPNRHT